MSNSVNSTKSSSKETKKSKPFKETRLEKNHDKTSSTISIFQIFDNFGFRIDFYENSENPSNRQLLVFGEMTQTDFWKTHPDKYFYGFSRI